MRIAILLFLTAVNLPAQQPSYDLLLKGGHVIDPKNNISKVMDVAIAGGKVARVAENIPSEQARTVANVGGLYVTPGLVDIHVHVYTGTALRASTARTDTNVQADAFSFRNGVTTMVDAGTSGWKNFPDFRDGVIKKSKTRILAMLNIVSAGMGTAEGENDPSGMDAESSARVAKENPEYVV